MENWDSEIDVVARQMTEGEPGASFKAEVLTRIDAVNPARRSRAVWIWSPAAAVAAVAALVILRPSWKADTVRLEPNTTYGTESTVRTEPDPSFRTKRAESPSYGVSSFSRTGDQASGSSRAVKNLSAVRGTSAAALRPRDPTLLAIEANARADRVDTLEPLPILVESFGVDAMATSTIQIPRLTVALLDVPTLGIAPLAVPAMGDQ